MHKIAVVGDRDSIYGFAAVGVDIFPTGAEEAPQLINKLAANRYAIIYVTENLYKRIGKEVEIFKEEIMPAIIPIPGAFGNNGIGFEQVKRFVEQAVGSDIIFGED